MYYYVKSLQYPINIKCRNPKLAKNIISQYGGPDGELGASLRYLSQRFGMPDQKSKAILNDIGTEEYAPIDYQLSLALLILGNILKIKFVGSESFFIDFSVFKYTTCETTNLSKVFLSSGVLKKSYISPKHLKSGIQNFSSNFSFSFSSSFFNSKIDLFIFSILSNTSFFFF